MSYLTKKKIPQNREPQGSSCQPCLPWLQPLLFQWQFVFRQCTLRILFLIGLLSDILYSKSLHICVADWLYCEDEWLFGCSYHCWHVAVLLLAFPLRRAWLSSWPRWHVDNPRDCRQQQRGSIVSVYSTHDSTCCLDCWVSCIVTQRRELLQQFKLSKNNLIAAFLLRVILEAWHHYNVWRAKHVYITWRQLSLP